MARTDALFELVQSLSKSEKRYFKLFASMQGSDKKYVLLFDAIDSQEEYDEEALKERFREEKFIRQFSVAKNYLYSLILKSLRMYGAGSTEQQLYEMLLDIGILERKGLTAHVRRAAAKATRIAEAQERFLVHVHLLQQRRRFQKDLLTTREGIDQFAEEQRTILEKFNNDMEYRLLFDRISRPLLGGEDVRTPEQLQEVEEVMRHPLMGGAEFAKSTSAQVHYYWVRAVNYFVKGEYANAIESLDIVIKNLESHPEVLSIFRRFYLSALHNIILLYRRSGDMESFSRTMAKLRSLGQIPFQTGRREARRGLLEEVDIFVTIYANMILLYLNESEFEQAAELIPEVELGLERYGDYLDDSARCSLLGNITYITFALGRYREALNYNNAILLASESWNGASSYQAARLINLIIHFELGNISLLKHLILSVQRALRSQNHLYPFEETLLEAMSQIVAARSKESRMKAFKEARARMEVFLHDPLEQNALRYFCYIEWIESHIQGRSIVEVAAALRGGET